MSLHPNTKDVFQSKCLTNNESTAVQSLKLTELKVETDLQAGFIKTNRSERQDSRYLDNKVMLAIFFLIQYLYIRHFK